MAESDEETVWRSGVSGGSVEYYAFFFSSLIVFSYSDMQKCHNITLALLTAGDNYQ